MIENVMKIVADALAEEYLAEFVDVDTKNNEIYVHDDDTNNGVKITFECMT